MCHLLLQVDLFDERVSPVSFTFFLVLSSNHFMLINKRHCSKTAHNKSRSAVIFEEYKDSTNYLMGHRRPTIKRHLKLLRISCFPLLVTLWDWLWSGKWPLPGKSLSFSYPPFVSWDNVSLSSQRGSDVRFG